MNRTPFPEAVEQAVMAAAPPTEASALLQKGTKPSALGAWWARIKALRRNYPSVLPYALVLFAGVSLQQSLILNLGPKIFQVHPCRTDATACLGTREGWSRARWSSTRHRVVVTVWWRSHAFLSIRAAVAPTTPADTPPTHRPATSSCG